MTVRIPPKTPGATSEVFTVDYRETAPALANKTMYVNNPEAAKYGGLAVGVPGELRGFEEAHHRWGHLPWRRLVQPSVELAAGWTVDVELARRIQVGDRHTAPSYCLCITDVLGSHAPQRRLACGVCPGGKAASSGGTHSTHKLFPHTRHDCK